VFPCIRNEGLLICVSISQRCCESISIGWLNELVKGEPKSEGHKSAKERVGDDTAPGCSSKVARGDMGVQGDKG
jgi:hypothetical protein